MVMTQVPLTLHFLLRRILLITFNLQKVQEKFLYRRDMIFKALFPWMKEKCTIWLLFKTF